MPELFKLIDALKSEQHIEHVDLIVGGPPCQAYSLVGRAVKSDNMVGDPRNYLCKLYIEVLKKYTPICSRKSRNLRDKPHRQKRENIWIQLHKLQKNIQKPSM